MARINRLQRLATENSQRPSGAGVGQDMGQGARPAPSTSALAPDRVTL